MVKFHLLESCRKHKIRLYGVDAMGTLIGAIVLGVISIICFVFIYLQYNEKGFLFNHSYIYISKQERKNMDKKPYYKQSGIVFVLIGIIFLISAIDITYKRAGYSIRL